MKQTADIIAIPILLAVGYAGCADGVPNHVQQQLNKTAQREYEYGHRSPHRRQPADTGRDANGPSRKSKRKQTAI